MVPMTLLLIFDLTKELNKRGFQVRLAKKHLVGEVNTLLVDLPFHAIALLFAALLIAALGKPPRPIKSRSR